MTQTIQLYVNSHYTPSKFVCMDICTIQNCITEKSYTGRNVQYAECSGDMVTLILTEVKVNKEFRRRGLS